MDTADSRFFVAYYYVPEQLKKTVRLQIPALSSAAWLEIESILKRELEKGPTNATGADSKQDSERPT